MVNVADPPLQDLARPQPVAVSPPDTSRRLHPEEAARVRALGVRLREGVFAAARREVDRRGMSLNRLLQVLFPARALKQAGRRPALAPRDDFGNWSL
jgi:hypothetical protein